MSGQIQTLTPEIMNYLRVVSLREPPLLQRLREETVRGSHASMQIAPEQGQFMALLVRLLDARRTIEVGVFTGYSSLCTALALPTGGRILACDTSTEWTDVARRYWREAGVEDRIDLRIAPALETLDAELAAGRAGAYDFAFIDADKQGTVDYYERCLELLRPNGLVLVDNVLWSGRVADPEEKDDATQALRRFNNHVTADARVDLSLLPLSDGLSLCRKR